ncbi:uncharacterized protein LOC128160909 [Crassostrea angulata]|uniref:uncharacterized protein LOC128160909 n=1 Tax=Magallana angulata TaxID=2784310 RepID=UPI0022B1D91A|nr:uncharacterized protein LOC128160909 [Crassostrea angulata]
MIYKNIFCQQCNDVNNELGDCFFFSDEYEQEESDYHDTDFDYNHIGETRQTLTFFTPKDFDDSYFQSQEKNTKCSYDQIFDDFAKVCRNLSCFDGKHLQNKTCVSYFKMTTNLRYTLAVKITFTTLAYVNATVKQTLEVFKNHIKNFVNATCKNPKIEKIILLHHDSCNTVISSQAEVSLFFTFFVNSSVNRDEIEEQLNMFTSASANWDLLETITLNVTVSRSEYALLLPLLMWKLDKRTHCFVQEERPELGPTEFLNVVVSPLLICQSLILKDYEFGVDWTSIRDEYVYKGLQFSSSQFDIYNDGFRVCKTDIAVYVSKMREISLGFENIFFTMFNKTLSTFTIVCNCFSLSFLLLTLITYSMFPEMRTLSGVNNMLLPSDLKNQGKTKHPKLL